MLKRNRRKKLTCILVLAAMFISLFANVMPVGAATYILTFSHCDNRYELNPSGFHFKQVLINDTVVWERDVTGDPRNTWCTDSVDVTQYVEGNESVDIKLRVYEKKGIGNYTVSVFWDDVSISGFTLPNGGFESNEFWTYSEVGTGFYGEYSAAYNSGAQSYLIRLPESTSTSIGDYGCITQTATAVPDITAPAAPANLTATMISSSQIDLNWTASEGENVTGYKVFRDGAEFPIGTTTETTYSNTGLSASTTYTYTVKAYNAEGAMSEASNEASATTKELPEFLNDDFNSTVTGSTPVGWDIVGDVKVADAPDSSDKSVLLVDPSASTYPAMTRVFKPKTGAMSLKFRAKVGQVNALCQAGLYDSSGKYIAKFRFNMDGTMTFFDGKETTTLLGYTKDTWYDIKIVMDTDGTYAVCYVNDIPRAVSKDFFSGLEKDFGKLQFFIGGTSIGTMNLDNIQLNTSYPIEIIPEPVIQEPPTPHTHWDIPDYIKNPDLYPDTYGCESNPTGDSIGGGEGYSSIIQESDADFVVSDVAGLQSALANATAGDIICVEDDAVIDCTDVPKQGSTNDVFYIPEGVTLASGRGRDLGNGVISQGGLIKTDYVHPNSTDHYCFFTVLGDDVRITGLRIQGNDDLIGEKHDWTGYSGGITCDDYQVEIDNCDISAFSYYGISCSNAYIHHNYIHHCRRTGYGYTILTVNSKEGHITYAIANEFDYYRHAVSAPGTNGVNYVCAYNLVRPNGIGHQFDVHGTGNNGHDGGTSGNVILVHHNTFQDVAHYGVSVRGTPITGCYGSYNWFYRYVEVAPGSGCIWQYNGNGNMFIGKNAYGENKEIIEGKFNQNLPSGTEDEISLNAIQDKQIGETLTVSGNTNLTGNINIKIIYQDGTILCNDDVTIDTNGIFTKEYTINSEWSKGRYNVYAVQEGTAGNGYFWVGYQIQECKFTSVDDSCVTNGLDTEGDTLADTNYGTYTILPLKKALDHEIQSYLKFETSGIWGVNNLKSAVLRLYRSSTKSDPAEITFDIWGINDDNWSETDITYNNQPVTLTPEPVVTKTDVISDVYYDFDVTSFVKEQLFTNDNILSFKVTSRSGEYAEFASKENILQCRPQLVISLDTSLPPVLPVPSDLIAAAISDSQIELSWNAMEDDGASGYKIFRSGLTDPIIVEEPGTAVYTDTGLDADTTYTYKVKAYDADGYMSEVSAEVSATTLSSSDIPPQGQPSEVISQIIERISDELSNGPDLKKTINLIKQFTNILIHEDDLDIILDNADMVFDSAAAIMEDLESSGQSVTSIEQELTELTEKIMEQVNTVSFSAINQNDCKKAVIEQSSIDMLVRKMNDITKASDRLNNALEGAGIELQIKPVLYIELTDTSMGLQSIVEFPGSVLIAASRKNMDSLVFDMGVASIVLTPDAISPGITDTVSLSADKLCMVELPSDIQKEIWNNNIYDFGLTVGDTEANSFDKPVEILLPYYNEPYIDTDVITVSYINDAGELDSMDGVYDKETKIVKFFISRTGKYIVE